MQKETCLSIFFFFKKLDKERERFLVYSKTKEKKTKTRDLRKKELKTTSTQFTKRKKDTKKNNF